MLINILKVMEYQELPYYVFKHLIKWENINNYFDKKN